jgi:hypothetical protein
MLIKVESGDRSQDEEREQASERASVKARNRRRNMDHSRSIFDSFLEQEGIREEVGVLAWQLERAMQESKCVVVIVLIAAAMRMS